LIPLLEAVPAVAGRPGRPRRRPDSVIADRGYDHDKYRRLVRERGVEPLIARRQSEHGSGLGRQRWVVERTFAWLHNFKRLLVRVGQVSTATTVLGTEIALPVVIAPLAMQRLAHPDGEEATARAAATAGTVMCLSSAATCAPKELPDGQRWFQVYVWRPRTK